MIQFNVEIITFSSHPVLWYVNKKLKLLKLARTKKNSKIIACTLQYDWIKAKIATADD